MLSGFFSFQVNLPYSLIETYGPRFLELGLAPEIGLDAVSLETTTLEEFGRWAERFKKVEVSLHAPFMDLSPGGFDPAVVEITRQRLKAAAGLAGLFRARHLIAHAYFDATRYPTKPERWLEVAARTWEEVLAVTEASQALVLLENVYETHPEMIRRLLDKISHPRLGCCFDVGHYHAWGRGARLLDWLEALGPYLKRLHLHDNDGSFDQHLGLGKGSFDFQALFAWLKAKGLRPALTLEHHADEDLEASVSYLAQLLGYQEQA